MKKEIFQKVLVDNLNKNFQSRSKYFDFNFFVFGELSATVFEINKCLILEFNKASITLTNNLIERLLKLSLIYYEAEVGHKQFEDLNIVYELLSKKYSSIPFGNSIEKCRKLDLITENEKVILFDTIRVLMRNGFSHADSTKILKNIPEETIMFKGCFSNLQEIKPVTINQNILPSIQALHTQNFANENAADYFDYVFDLIKKLDKRLTDRIKNSELDMGKINDCIIP